MNGATSMAKSLGRTRGKRVPEAGPSRSWAELHLHQNLSRCQIRTYWAKHCLYNGDTATSARQSHQNSTAVAHYHAQEPERIHQDGIYRRGEPRQFSDKGWAECACYIQVGKSFIDIDIS